MATGAFTFVALVGFKHLDQVMRLELFRVLDGHLHNYLKVLTEVAIEHFFQAFQGLIHGKSAKVVYQPFSSQQMGLRDDSLDVMDIGKVFQSLANKRLLSE
jgi:hypothetical protein